MAKRKVGKKIEETTKVELSKGDACLIQRRDGSMEMAIPHQSPDDRVCPEVAMLTFCGCLLSSKDSTLMDLIVEKFGDDVRRSEGIDILTPKASVSLEVVDGEATPTRIPDSVQVDIDNLDMNERTSWMNIKGDVTLVNREDL